jgi:phage terminase large subunit-like protein
MVTTERALTVKPGYRGLLAFCELIGEGLEPHERKIARAHFGDERELYAILPRGNLKTTLAAKLGLHHLMSTPGASVTIGAASRDQARIAYERMRGFAQHPALEDSLIIRHLELRYPEHDGQLRLLRVVPSDGPRTHGLSSTLYIGDEIWAWAGGELLGAMLTGLVKNPQARFFGISTSAPRTDSPLARARMRALAGEAHRKGAFLDAMAPGIRWLEWSLPEGQATDDMRAVARCNPAGYITRELLEEQAGRVTPLEFAQFHCCQWGVEEGAWLPAGAWKACAGDWAPKDAPVYLGVDVGGTQSASAIVGVDQELNVAEVHIFQGDEAVLAVVDRIVEIARRRRVLQVGHDPWRFHSEALRLERNHGLEVVKFAMGHAGQVAISEALYSAVVGKRLTHPDHPKLNRHAKNAVAKSVGRGWKLDKPTIGDHIDALHALGMAIALADAPRPEPPRFLGFDLL